MDTREGNLWLGVTKALIYLVVSSAYISSKNKSVEYKMITLFQMKLCSDMEEEILGL